MKKTKVHFQRGDRPSLSSNTPMTTVEMSGDSEISNRTHSRSVAILAVSDKFNYTIGEWNVGYTNNNKYIDKSRGRLYKTLQLSLLENASSIWNWLNNSVSESHHDFVEWCELICVFFVSRTVYHAKHRTIDCYNIFMNAAPIKITATAGSYGGITWATVKSVSCVILHHASGIPM